MTERSVQLNIRTAASVAEALRDEALRRDIALGDVLKELLLRARASTQCGVWLTLPDEVQSALEAVAAARALEPSQVLTQMVAGELQGRLLVMAENLGGPAGARGSSAPVGAAHRSPPPAARPAPAPPSEAPEQGSTPERPRSPGHGLPSLGAEDNDEDVGIFTVFE
jgi:hypothetical protein